MNLATTTTPLLSGASQAPLPKDLEGACRALEKAFTQIMFQEMRKSVMPSTGGGAGGFARTSTEGMLDAQWAELSSQGEGMGLWRALYRQMDPESVKSSAGEPDEWPRGTPHRKEADHVTQGGIGTPGPRLGHPRPAAFAAADTGISRLSIPQKRGAAGTPAEDLNP